MNKRFRIFLCFFASFCILMCSEVGRAQVTTASLQVSVSDRSGAKISAAQAKILNVETGFMQTLATDASGVVVFPRLAVGQYKLIVDKQGFTQYVQSGIVLTVGQAASDDVVLQVGSVSTEVTVTSAVPMVDTRDFSSDSLIGQEQVVDLPLDGRMAQTLIQTAPGSVSMDRYDGILINAQGGVYPGESDDAISGTQRTALNYQLDGVTHNDTYVNAALPFPDPDAIQEFALQSSNFSAEYGDAAAGVVNIVSKSGTNQFHGDAFNFYRDQFMNASGYFSRAVNILHRNQFGGTVGGPILRGKLFFFGSYQGTRNESASGADTEFTPDAAERTGDFSEYLRLSSPIQLVNSQTGVPYKGDILPAPPTLVQNLLKYIPVPNGPNNAVTFQGAQNKSTDNQYLGKIDYSRGKNQVTGSYFWTKYDDPAFASQTNLLAVAGGNEVRIQNLSVNHTYVQSPTLLFNTTYGWVQQVGGSTSGAPFSLGSLGMNIANGTPPEIQLYVFGNGFSILSNHQGFFNRGDWVVRENVTKVAGKNEIHLGGEFLKLYNKLTNTYFQSGLEEFRGWFSGDSFADLMLGELSYFGQGGGQYGNIGGTETGFWAQDNLRVTDALTINAGLRWDPWFPFHDLQGRTICFVPGQQSKRYPNAPEGMLYGGSNHDAGCPAAGSDSYLPQFGPRVGFAYRLNKEGSRSIRGGFGIYYVPIPTANYLGSSSAPFSPQFSFWGINNFTNPWGSLGLANPFPAEFGPKLPGPSATFTLPTSISAVNPQDFRESTYNSWNLILEQQLRKTSVARLAYVGNEARHLSEEMPREVNAPIYGPGATAANEQQRVPYPNFGNVMSQDSNGISKFHALEATFETRMNNGLTLTANYTWSRSLDDINEYSDGQQTDPWSRMFDYGPSAGNSTNNFKLSEVWTVPIPHVHGDLVERLARGWEISSFTTWQGGEPFTIFAGDDNSLTGVGLDRADYLGGPIKLAGGRSHAAQIAEWFNISQFVPNAIGTFGSSSRNKVVGPRFFNTNAALMKNTTITENVKLQLRGEAFNAFNHTNFDEPDRWLGPGFGVISSAEPARVMQLSAKIVF